MIFWLIIIQAQVASAENDWFCQKKKKKGKAAAAKLQNPVVVTVHKATASHTEQKQRNNRWQSSASDFLWCNKTTWAELNTDNKK